MFTDPNNRERAARIDPAFAAYIDARSDSADGDWQCDATDLVTDVLHWARAKGVDLPAMMRSAIMHFKIEEKEEKEKEVSAPSEFKRFQEGQTYSCRSVCNHESVYSYTVVKRTAKQLTLTTDHDGTIRRGVSMNREGTGEICLPEGRYSMCPVIRA